MTEDTRGAHALIRAALFARLATSEKAGELILSAAEEASDLDAFRRALAELGG